MKINYIIQTKGSKCFLIIDSFGIIITWNS